MQALPLDPMLTSDQTLLVVDDDEDLARLVVDFCKDLGFSAVAANSAKQALEVCGKNRPSIVLTDLVMPEVSGAALLKQLKEENPTMPVLVMSMVNSVKQAVELLKVGADDYLVKPLDFDVLRNRLEVAARKVSTVHDLEALKELVSSSFRNKVGIIWGTSEAMLEVAAQVPRIALTRASVLVHGESGTGKELFARAVHYASKRAKGPMISVSCASIPDGLWERELFGHVKGAFSDAGAGGPGVVEAAEGGTLFLDEVGEIPISIQPKLLRFLQEREYRAVGSTTLQKADLRIIAATNRDLRHEIAEGRFREDLYYRLNVLQLHLPSLRKRKEDIPHLASHFLHRYIKEFEKPAVGFSSRAIQKLSSYDYPGNVRELENVVQQALVAARHSVVIANDIPVGDPGIVDQGPSGLLERGTQSIDGSQPPAAEPAPAPGASSEVDFSLPYNEAKQQATEAFEMAYVSRILEQHSGNVTRAATAAGLPRKSLARIMSRHDIAAGPDGQGGRPGRPPADGE